MSLYSGAPPSPTPNATPDAEWRLEAGWAYSGNAVTDITVIGIVVWVLPERDFALALEERDFASDPEERDLELVLEERDFGFELKKRDFTWTLDDDER